MQREAAPKAGAGAASAEELCLQPQDRAMALGAAVPWGQLLPREQLCRARSAPPGHVRSSY